MNSKEMSAQTVPSPNARTRARHAGPHMMQVLVQWCPMCHATLPLSLFKVRRSGALTRHCTHCLARAHDRYIRKKARRAHEALNVPTDLSPSNSATK